MFWAIFEKISKLPEKVNISWFLWFLRFFVYFGGDRGISVVYDGLSWFFEKLPPKNTFIALQRTSNHGHTTPRSQLYPTKRKKVWNFPLKCRFCNFLIIEWFIAVYHGLSRFFEKLPPKNTFIAFQRTLFHVDLTKTRWENWKIKFW